MEFDVQLTTQESGVAIVDNNDYEKLKSDLALRLETYSGLIVTEDGIKEAKKDRAALNKLRAAIADRVKEIRGEYMKPFDSFKARADELIRMIDEPIEAIDSQVKGYEQRTKDEKQQRIVQFFNEHIGALQGCITLEQIWDKRWLNLTFKEDDVYDIILEKFDTLSRNIETIRSMNLPFEAEILNVLFTTLDLSTALRRKTQLEETAARIEEMRKVQENAPKVAQEPPHEVAPEPVHEETHNAAPEAVRVIDFRIWATTSQLQALKQFLLANNIKYGRVAD